MDSFRIIISLCAGAVFLIILPNKVQSQVPRSTYPVSDPAFILGYKNLLDTIRLSLHSGLGPMAGSPPYLGTFAPVLPPLPPPGAAAAASAGGSGGASAGGGGGGDDGS